MAVIVASPFLLLLARIVPEPFTSTKDGLLLVHIIFLFDALNGYTFTFNFSLCKTYAYITIDGQAIDSNVFIDTMRKELLNIPNIKFDEERFNNFIRSHIAYQIRKFNSVEAIANSLND